jgi:antitoxin (DNA-binding transcriptional repressor) of toxin-antitoxin stability system
LYNIPRKRNMKLAISETRRRLPELVRLLRKNSEAKVQITVHGEVVAELRAAQPEPEPGSAARKLLELMKKLPRHRGRRSRLSTQVKKQLYGPQGAVR